MCAQTWSWALVLAGGFPSGALSRHRKAVSLPLGWCRLAGPHTAATGSALLHPSSEAKLEGPEQLPQRKTSLEPRPSDKAHTSHPQRKELGAPLASVAGTVRMSMCHVSTMRDSVGLRTTVSRVSWSPPSQVEAGVSERGPAGAGKDGGGCQRKLWTSKAGHELGPSEAALLGTVLQLLFFLS